MTFLGKSDVGRVRATNQDTFTFHEFDEGCRFAVVCDGMGGHNGGNVASELATKVVKDTLISSIEGDFRQKDIESIIKNAVLQANNNIFAAALKDSSLKGMGTTIVLVFILDSVVSIAHVGDSRAYLYHDKKISRLTTDHSLVQEMIDMGELKDEDAVNHPYKHIITRALGKGADVKVDYKSFLSDKDDFILICSDGLSNLISDVEMQDIVNNEFSEDICDKLVSAANQRGGYDNITVVMVKCR